MAKLYTLLRDDRLRDDQLRSDLLGDTDNQIQQFKLFPSTAISGESYSCGQGFSEVVTEYNLAKCSPNEPEVYEVREPRPALEGDSSSAQPVMQLQNLLDQATSLCNDLDELIALHYCFFEAVESVHNTQRPQMGKKAGKRGEKPVLSVFPQWLRERDITVLEAIHSLQQSIRITCKKSQGWAEEAVSYPKVKCKAQ